MNATTLDYPRPNLAHILAAVAIILLSLVFIGTLVPALIIPDGCTTFSAIIFLPWPVILAVVQYRGTFRRNPKSARIAFLSSVFLAVLPFLVLGVVLTSGAAFAIRFSFWLKLMAASLLTLGMMLANGHWYWELKEAVTDDWIGPASRIISLRESLLFVGAICVVLGVAVPIVHNTKPNQALHVTAEETPFSLPEGAYDVTYFRYFGGTRFQCTAEEDAFLAWYDEGVGTLESLAANQPLDPIQKPTGTGVIVGFAANGPITEPQSVTSGWKYYWNREDRWVSVLYDRLNKRLYYEINTR
ncbi:hypothetical protein DTL42_17625 [Bremerella cremea]|uniref:DUF1616 domain-containing protein n=1 Tax=Bremerella cremea TaxID=1031537 RepID=A0A368KNC3_9BACT|nr:hypothetical protein [Bremerella cremea]RCS44738.1 hypothetical protein DTL42_17625 [Bremerella cremea]